MNFETPQQLFDYVVNALREQGGPSHSTRVGASEANLSCLYRSPTGRKCAAGVLITDEVYDKSWEGVGIGSLINMHDKGALAYLAPFRALISALQSCHDEAFLAGLPTDDAWMLAFEDRAAKVALAYNLTYTPARGRA